MLNLSNEIKAYRQRYNLTQAEVAARMGISCATYVSYENNPYNMSLSMFIKLCEALDEKLATIFFTQELYNMYKNNNSTEQEV